MWYNTGTITVTNASATVTGSGTDFISGAQVGEALYVGGNLYEILAIVSATEITLKEDFIGTTQSGLSYKIIPTQSLVGELASQVTELITDYSDVKDLAGSGKFQDGTVGAPSITFEQDQNNGLYRVGTDNWGLVSGGHKAVDLTPSKVTVDADLKVRDQLTINTDAELGDITISNKLHITGDDNYSEIQSHGQPLHINRQSGLDTIVGDDLGVNTTPEDLGSGYTHIEVDDTTSGVISVSSGGERGLSASVSGDDGVIETRKDGGDLVLKTRNTTISEKARLTSDGKLGLGVSNPTATLDVAGDVDVTGDSTQNTIGKFTRTKTSGTSGTYLVEIDNSSQGSNVTASGALAIDVYDGRALTINGKGDVEIGSTDVTSNLGVTGTVSASNVEIDNTTTGYDVTSSGKATVGIDIDGNGGAEGDYGGAISFGTGGVGRSAISAVQTHATDKDGNGLAFFTHPSSGSTADAHEVMRLTGGNLGIGTSSPNAKLDVKTDSANSAYIQVGTTFNGTQTVGSDIGGLEFYSGDASGAGAGVKGSIRYKNLNTTGASTAMTFHTSDASGNNDVERMRLVLGNLGIGNASPLYKLDIEDSSTVSTRVLSTNATSSSVKLEVKGGASQLTSTEILANSSGALTFATGTTSSSEKARITDGGEFFVDCTANPVSSATITGMAYEPANNYLALSSSGRSLYLNRATTGDGAMQTFRKQGTTIGELGVANTDNLYISGNSTHAGLNFGTDQILPFKNGAVTGGVISLGDVNKEYKDAHFSGTVNAKGLEIVTPNGGDLSVRDYGSSVGIGHYTGSKALRLNATHSVRFFTGTEGNETERCRVTDDGSYLHGRISGSPQNSSSNSVSDNGLQITSTGKVLVGQYGGSSLILNRTGNDGTVAGFSRNGTSVGTVSVTATSTSYNTSSDYRLKENESAITDAVERVQALKPYRFDWKATGERVDGFFAHEVQEVIPEAVTGTKDEVDEDGNDVMQSIDQSKIVPLLTSALQDALTEIESLKQRLNNLEN